MAEEFWKLENMNNEIYRNCWKIAGVLGGVIGVIECFITEKMKDFFLIPALLTGLIVILYGFREVSHRINI